MKARNPANGVGAFSAFLAGIGEVLRLEVAVMEARIISSEANALITKHLCSAC